MSFDNRDGQGRGSQDVPLRPASYIPVSCSAMINTSSLGFGHSANWPWSAACRGSPVPACVADLPGLGGGRAAQGLIEG